MTFLRMAPPGGPDRSSRPLVRPLRRVAEMLATPLVPEDYLDLLDPRGATRPLRGTVVAIQPRPGDAAELWIRPGRGWQGHRPGQYVRVGVEVEGVRHWRAYSITSRADEPLISVAVHAITDGVVSNELVHRSGRGTRVLLEQADGDFTWSDRRPKAVLLVTAGSGITPAMGILRNHRHEIDDVVLVHSTRDADGSTFGDELGAWAREGSVRLIERHTGINGRLNLSELDTLVPDWQTRSSYVSGPTGLIDASQSHWAEAGLAARLHTERFQIGTAAGVADSGGMADYSRSGKRVEVDAGTSLLDAGERAGVLMPSGCRMGICFGCVATLRSGAVQDLRSGAVTTADPAAPMPVQTCISSAAGDCEIDL